MSKVLILKGLPASGKSTYAKKLVAGSIFAMGNNWKRVNKDDIRAMLDNSFWSKENERFTIATRDLIIVEALSAGCNVVVDDTNFNPQHERAIRDLVASFKPKVEVEYFDTPLDVCLKRNKERNNRLKAAGLPTLVTDGVIYSMYNQNLADGQKISADRVHKYKPEKEVKPTVATYAPPEGKPRAILCDIDGTLAHMVDRGPFEWHKVGSDIVDEKVANVIRKYAQRDPNDEDYLRIVIMSGRDAICRPETTKWLNDNNIPFDELHMRTVNDSRKDNIIKQELFDRHIKDFYQVEFVLDDRNQVVDMWRNELGLKVFQVAEGNF